jgi:hypothetical protein
MNIWPQKRRSIHLDTKSWINRIYGNYQYSGSVTFLYGSGSLDPYHTSAKRIRIGTLVHLHHSSKIKINKEVTEQ